MSSIGPQIPPHLAKRKRTPDPNDDHDSPPSKATRIGPSAPTVNRDEIDLDEDSDDDYGPSAPASTAQVAGPTFPPPTSKQSPKRNHGPAPPTSNQDSINLSASDSSPHGPSAPIPRVAGPSLPHSTSKPLPKRIHGPAPPPAALSERPPAPPSDSDSDSDSYGPALPSSMSLHKAPTHPTPNTTSTAPSPPKRDAWMLAPPTSSTARTPDPTRLKARKFASGPRASTSGPSEISSIWTETASQKADRLRDQVLGRNAPDGTSSTNNDARTRKDARREERDERIRAAVEGTRGRSLYESHQDVRDRVREGGKKVEEEDDPSKRAFDREKDMAVGGAIGGKERREMMSQAKDFGGRFQKGSFL